MQSRILVVVAMLMLIGTVWSCGESAKESQWKKLSDNQYSNLAQCLDYAKEVPGLVKDCEEMEEKVNTALGK